MERIRVASPSVERALRDSHDPSPAALQSALRRLVGHLQRGQANPADQSRISARLFELFEHADPRVFRMAMNTVAEAGATLADDVVASMVGRLATMGANADRPQANDALRALRRLEDEAGPRAPD